MTQRLHDGVCETIGCREEATHTLTWPGWDGEPVTELVCEPCGEVYARRPSLNATLEPIG